GDEPGVAVVRAGDAALHLLHTAQPRVQRRLAGRDALVVDGGDGRRIGGRRAPDPHGVTRTRWSPASTACTRASCGSTGTDASNSSACTIATANAPGRTLGRARS